MLILKYNVRALRSAMDATKLIDINSLKNSKFWLLGISATLIAIHLTLISRANDDSLLGTCVLFWLAVSSMVWSKQDSLNLNSGFFSSLWGLFLITLVLFKSAFIFQYDYFLRFSPLLSALGIALLASGIKGLKQYWRELLILCFLVPSPGAIALLIDISTFTAQFTTVILWYLGFDVVRQGVFIHLATGSVEVYPGCSGIESMLQMLGLAVLFLVIFPTNKQDKIFVPILAIFTAFIVNGFRVALMAVLAASSEPQSLHYWHKGDGSLIFSTLSVAILGLYCLFLLRRSNLDIHHREEYQEL